MFYFVLIMKENIFTHMHVTDVALLKHMKLYDCPKCIDPRTENYPFTQISEGCNHSLDCDDGCIAVQAMNRLQRRFPLAPFSVRGNSTYIPNGQSRRQMEPYIGLGSEVSRFDSWPPPRGPLIPPGGPTGPSGCHTHARHL